MSVLNYSENTTIRGEITYIHDISKPYLLTVTNVTDVDFSMVNESFLGINKSAPIEISNYNRTIPLEHGLFLVLVSRFKHHTISSSLDFDPNEDFLALINPFILTPEQKLMLGINWNPFQMGAEFAHAGDYSDKLTNLSYDCLWTKLSHNRYKSRLLESLQGGTNKRTPI